MSRFVSLSVLLIATLLATPALAGWELIESGTDNHLNAFRLFNSTWLVGDDGTLLASTDNGITWTAQNSGTAADLRESHMPSSSNWWLAGSGGTVLVSTDQGASWDPRGPGDATANLRTIFSRSSGLAFAAGDQGKVFYSNNVGQNWFPRHIGTADNLFTGISPTIGGLAAIVAGEGGVMFLTDDAGVTWTPVVTGTSHDIHAMIGGPGNSILAFGAGGTILRSDDFGVTWTTIPSPVTTTLYGASTSGASSNYVMACGADGTLIKSTDGGLTWGALYNPYDADLFDVYGYNNSIWVACGAGGIIIRTEDGGGDIVAVDDLPSTRLSVELLPAVPNPFNPQVSLRYRLDESGSVLLAVYAVDGGLVRTLISGRREAGIHEVSWDGRDSAGLAMPSGAYLARLVAGGEAVTRRMQLVR